MVRRYKLRTLYEQCTFFLSTRATIYMDAGIEEVRDAAISVSWKGCWYSAREYCMIYRGTGFLAVV